jgi:hypothetical protein
VIPPSPLNLRADASGLLLPPWRWLSQVDTRISRWNLFTLFVGWNSWRLMAISNSGLMQRRKTTGRPPDPGPAPPPIQQPARLAMPYQYPPSIHGNAQMQNSSLIPLQPSNTAITQFPTASYVQSSQMPLSQESNSQLALRRSFSMPDQGSISDPLAEEQSQGGSSGDKRRTKLGYARTSMACRKFFMRLL